MLEESEWRKEIESQIELLEDLKAPFDVELLNWEIYPEDEIPVRGLNSETVNPAATTKRFIGLKGYARIELLWKQAGFVDFCKRTQRCKINQIFLIHIYFPRNFDGQTGVIFLFKDDGDYEIPAYPNIMKRDRDTDFNENLNWYSGTTLSSEFPDGMIAGLVEDDSHIFDESLENQIIRLHSYLSLNNTGIRSNSLILSDSERIMNDRGFDRMLFQFFLENYEILVQALVKFQPQREEWISLS